MVGGLGSEERDRETKKLGTYKRERVRLKSVIMLVKMRLMNILDGCRWKWKIVW